MVEEDEKSVEERVKEILAIEERKERLNRVVPIVLIYVLGILMIIAVLGIIYKIIENSGGIGKANENDTQRIISSLSDEREKFDLYFNPKFTEIAGKVDFIDSWFLNEERNKLTIRVKKNWYEMKDYEKISALKILKEKFTKIYAYSNLSEKTIDSLAINLINFNGDIIAVCDKNGASLKNYGK